jgi:LuxR family maltose regulon positive regulatory protein
LLYVASVLDANTAGQSPEAITIAVINEVVRDPLPRTLILDNFHSIIHPDVHPAGAYLLNHRPPTLRLVIAGRMLSPRPLARIRPRHRERL